MSENTRYSVGQEIIIVNFTYGSTPDNRFSNRPFLFGAAVYPIVSFETLTVTEHHKVPWDQDPKGELKYDGFVLKDSKGRIWHNQYPKASYGQISDQGDRTFYLPYWKAEAEDKENDKAYSDAKFVEGETLTGFISDFYKALSWAQPGTQAEDAPTRTHSRLIIKFFEDFQKRIFKEFKKAIKIKQYMSEEKKVVLSRAELVDAETSSIIFECIPMSVPL